MCARGCALERAATRARRGENRKARTEIESKVLEEKCANTFRIRSFPDPLLPHFLKPYNYAAGREIPFSVAVKLNSSSNNVRLWPPLPTGRHTLHASTQYIQPRSAAAHLCCHPDHASTHRVCDVSGFSGVSSDALALGVSSLPFFAFFSTVSPSSHSRVKTTTPPSGTLSA